MDNLKKTDFQCLICNKILNDPIDLPCNCTIFHKHLKDDSVKNGLIKCGTCNEEFLVKDLKIKVNKIAKLFLDSEQHLGNEEKQLKSEVHILMKKFHQFNEKISST